MPPRIAFIDYFPTHYRKRLYEEIAKRTDADFYFYADEQRDRTWNRQIPIRQNTGAYRRIEYKRFYFGGQAVMPGVARPILEGRYDAVVKNLNGKLQLPLTIGAARAARVPWVLWTGMWYHPDTLVHRVSRPVTEAVYRDAGAIVAYGQHVKDYLLESTRGLEPEKIFVAGQAVEPERFTAVSPDGNGAAPEVLYVGQFEERKGLTYLVEAFEALGPGRGRLRLVGNGSQEEWLRSRVAGRDDVEIVGYRPQDELPSELARARCLVLPSITTDLDKEPWGLVVNEAMHVGIPVVTSDAVGAAAGGLVQDGRNGFIVPERDSESLSGALAKLVDDAGLARRMGEAAREDAAAFTHGRMADAFRDAVEYAIAAR